MGDDMRPLIIMVALLPVLIIVLGIEFVNQITIGELIAIVISSLIILTSIIAYALKLTSPSRAYNMTLFDSHIDRLISNSNNEIKEYKVRNDKLVEIHVRITAKIGANIDKIRFRLVKRGHPCWRWTAEQPSRAFVECIWDKDLERESAINQYQLSRGAPLYTQEDETGILYFGNRKLLKGDVMWYRVIIHANENWDGYLEYCGASGDNRRAYSRRKIILRLTPDKEGSQT